MSRKTFISYKYSEAQDLRDKIIKALGDDAQYYQGETCDSPDLTDYTAETIKNHLKDMIFSTSVTIVVISPHMTESKWIDWEIEYSLRNYNRDGTTSHTNGIVGVIMKVDGGYDWIRSTVKKPDGHTSTQYDTSKMYPIINNNRFNQNPQVYFCPQCKTYDALTGSYIALVTQDEFLADPDKYIENAHDKCQSVNKYEITKSR